MSAETFRADLSGSGSHAAQRAAAIATAFWVGLVWTIKVVLVLSAMLAAVAVALGCAYLLVQPDAAYASFVAGFLKAQKPGSSATVSQALIAGRVLFLIAGYLAYSVANACGNRLGKWWHQFKE
jgi:DMSO/TMAO reductase YedYZ heme-binding membrane subunit